MPLGGDGTASPAQTRYVGELLLQLPSRSQSRTYATSVQAPRTPFLVTEAKSKGCCGKGYQGARDQKSLANHANQAHERCSAVCAWFNK